ncbi:DUF2142 domain-containing protein [Glaciibacter flavus]|uniref:DUF2142 domain-containing protein n=1 Tax=Orlajensenia flava TaxID=2565934 RepID=UPI003AFFC286
MFAALLAWGVSSPMGSSPDDDYHLASIWCGLGQRDGLCETSTHKGQMVVPKALIESPHCYATRNTEAGDCDLPDASVMVSTTRGNFQGIYPPGFYAVMGVFASPNLTVSLLVMRAINAFLYVALLTLAVLLIPRQDRGSPVWAAVVTTVPLAAFIIPSVNPSSWAITSASVVWVAFTAYFRVADRRRAVGLGLLGAAAFLMGAFARADAAFYGIAAIAIAFLLSLPTRGAGLRWRRLILPLVLAVIGSVTYFSSGQTGVATGEIVGQSRLSVFAQLYVNIVRLPELWAGSLGTNGLGWLDTPMSALVWFPAVGAFCAVVFSGLRNVNGGRLVSLAILGALLVALPLYILGRSHLGIGDLIQPRYLLPLLIILAGVALYQHKGLSAGLSREQMLIVAVGLAIANSWALHTNLRRYVTGLDDQALNLNAHSEWWWNWAVGPMEVWILGSVAFTAFLSILYLASRRDDHRDRAEPTPPVGNAVLG